MALSTDAFLAAVIGAVPDAESIVQEHLEDNFGQLLLHLLVADLRRYCIAAFEGAKADDVRRCLDVLARGLREGDELVKNAVAVSFVEDTG